MSSVADGAGGGDRDEQQRLHRQRMAHIGVVAAGAASATDDDDDDDDDDDVYVNPMPPLPPMPTPPQIEAVFAAPPLPSLPLSPSLLSTSLARATRRSGAGAAGAAGGAMMSSKSLQAMVRPCEVGAVARCCLRGERDCAPYVVDAYDERAYGVAGERTLGEGAQGVVYLTDKGYVVKCNRPVEFEDEASGAVVVENDLSASDLREITTLRNLVHPNIVAFTQVVLDPPGGACGTRIVMPFYKRTLLSLLSAAEPPVTCDRRVRARFLYQLLRAVAFMHSRGVMHRDVKPDNILVDGTADDDPMRARLLLADFGLAEGAAIGGSATQRETNVYTLPYRAPEILLGDARYGANADVWALGIVWLEMLGVDSLYSRTQFDGEQLMRIFLVLGAPAAHDWHAAASALPQWQAVYAKPSSVKAFARHVPSLDASLAALRASDGGDSAGGGGSGGGSGGGGSARGFRGGGGGGARRRCIVDDVEYALLRRVLAVNPSRRIDAAEALADRFFDDVRDDVARQQPAPPLPAMGQPYACYDALLAIELEASADADAALFARHGQALHEGMYAMVVGWLYDVHKTMRQQYKYDGLRTYAACVAMLRRYVAAPATLPGDVTDENVQAIGIACYMLASKLLENVPLETQHAAVLIGDGGGGGGGGDEDASVVREIERLERAIVLRLDADLDRPSTASFWQVLARKNAGADAGAAAAVASTVSLEESERLLATYLQRTAWQGHRGSQIAYAALVVANWRDSPCMRHYERAYPQWFNADVVRRISEAHSTGGAAAQP